MNGTHKLLFAISLGASLLAFDAASAQGQPARPRGGVEVKPRDNVTAAENRQQPLGDELRCRGGADAFRFEKVDEQQRPGGETVMVLRIFFKASPRAAGVTGSGLEPGTCSWVDRPMNDKEPKEMLFDTLANAQLKQALKGTEVDRSPTAAEKYPDAITIPAYLSDGKHYFSFFVVNALSQYFAVQNYRAWKPSVTEQVVKPKDLLIKP